MDIGKLLDDAKSNQGIKSDYALSKLLDVSHPAVRKWRSGEGLPSIENGYALALLAGRDARKVVRAILRQGTEPHPAAEVFR